GVEELYDQLLDPAELDNLAKSGEPGIRSIIETMRTELIHWCRENGDYAMLENGMLKKTACSPAKNWPKPANPFGRRLY
ncbi:MAG: hypothetical protein K0Q90_3627, partial [Paenibacillaceae bacterium]|nr:hypothetical protein [Paenibacillaceae bacterium]